MSMEGVYRSMYFFSLAVLVSILTDCLPDVFYDYLWI